MRTQGRRFGGKMSRVVWKCGSLVALVVLSGAPCSAYILDAAISVDPSKPSSYGPTTIRLSGWSSDSCVPTDVSFFEDEHSLFLNQSDGPCAAVVTPWSLALVFPEPLPSGFFVFDFYEWDGGFLERFAFEVADRTGAVLHGIVSRRAVCKNLTTHQKVVVPAHSNVVNCEAAGLTVRQGDKVLVRSRGVASPP